MCRLWRVLGGFALAAVLALPLGVMMGAYKPVEAFFEPFVSFARIELEFVTLDIATDADRAVLDRINHYAENLLKNLTPLL